MLKWPIRVKLIAGLSLVVGMMLTLMGGSIFGLKSFHHSYLTLVDQLPELGASKELMKAVVRLDALRGDRIQEDLHELGLRVEEARKALATYADVLRKNTSRGNRANDGR